MKRVSDAKLVEALIIHGGVRQAADRLGLTRGAVYKRLRDPAVRAAVDTASDGVLEAASVALSTALDSAVGALVDVVHDPSVSPGLRVQAAAAILSHGARFLETVTLTRRVERLEATSCPD